MHQRPRNHRSLHLATGKQVDTIVRTFTEAELRQELISPVFALAFFDAVVGGVEEQILADRDPAFQVVVLRYDREMSPGVDGIIDDIDTGNTRFSRRRTHA